MFKIWIEISVWIIGIFIMPKYMGKYFKHYTNMIAAHHRVSILPEIKKEIEYISSILGSIVFIIWLEIGAYKIHPQSWLGYLLIASLLFLIISWIGGVNQIKRELEIIPPRIWK
jgi:hypothetical protein